MMIVTMIGSNAILSVESELSNWVMGSRLAYGVSFRFGVFDGRIHFMAVGSPMAGNS